MMALPIEEPRCLAYDLPHPTRKKLPIWCDLRESCQRALAIRNSDSPIINYRVCRVGETDAFIEAVE